MCATWRARRTGGLLAARVALGPRSKQRPARLYALVALCRPLDPCRAHTRRTDSFQASPEMRCELLPLQRRAEVIPPLSAHRSRALVARSGAAAFRPILCA
jgi:hypothetical protein